MEPLPSKLDRLPLGVDEQRLPNLELWLCPFIKLLLALTLLEAARGGGTELVRRLRVSVTDGRGVADNLLALGRKPG